MTQFTTMLCLIKYELYISMFIIFNCGFSTKVSTEFPAQENMQKWSEFNTYKPRKVTSTLLLHYWSDNGFKGTIVNQAFPSLMYLCVNLNYAMYKSEKSDSPCNRYYSIIFNRFYLTDYYFSEYILHPINQSTTTPLGTSRLQMRREGEGGVHSQSYSF